MREDAYSAASSAKYAVVQNGRVYAGCLDYDPISKQWTRPTVVQVSGYQQPWAFPSVVQHPLYTDGGEIDYNEGASAIRGMLALDNDILVFTDAFFYHLRGEDPITGWQVIGKQRHPLAYPGTLALANRAAIWHDGEYWRGYGGGGDAVVLSRDRVESGLIAEASEISAVWCHDQYVCLINPYNLDEYMNQRAALVIFDSAHGNWHVRRSHALDAVAGICTDGQKVYGVTIDGDVVDLFGGDLDYSAESVETRREAWTQYVELAPAGKDIHVEGIVIEALAPAATSLKVTCRWHGLKNGVVTKTLDMPADQTRHVLKLNVQCCALKIELTHTGENAPEIYSFGPSRSAEACR